MKLVNIIFNYFKNVFNYLKDIFSKNKEYIGFNDANIKFDILYNTAVHEAGHCCVAWSCSAVDNVDVIVDKTGGKTHFIINYDMENKNFSIWCNLVILLAGPAAELIVYKKWRSGHSKSDLEKAIVLAETIDQSFIIPKFDGKSLKFSKIYRNNIDERTEELLKQAYLQAKIIIKSYKNNF